MSRIILFLIIVLLGSCKKDLYREEPSSRIIHGNLLTVSDAQRFVKTAFTDKLSRQKINKLSSVNPAKLSDITDNMADSVYAKFYWEYATEETNIDGHPAILVPIKMTEKINVSIADGMDSIGYRVAVFQHTPDKSEVLISFRDYHPDEVFVRAKMLSQNISKYPTDFLEFREVLLEDFSGHILALDKALLPLRLLEVENNVPIRYIDLPYSLMDPALPDIPFETFSVEYECLVQIAYPDYETTVIRERYSYINPNIETSWDKISQNWVIGQVEISYLTYTETTVKWKTETSFAACNISSQGTSISIGVKKYKFNIPEHLYSLDCMTKKKINELYGLFSNNNKAIRAYKDPAGNPIEAAYSLYYDDLQQGNIAASVISTGTESFVPMETSWAKIQGGYHFAYNHYHPNGLPFSSYDIFFPLNTYQWIENRGYTPEERQDHLNRFTNDFIFRIEVGGGDFYVYTIKDINALKQLAGAKTADQYYQEEFNARNKILDDITNKQTQKTVAEKLLLDLFGDAVNIYKGSTDVNGNMSVAKMHKDSSGDLNTTPIDCF